MSNLFIALGGTGCNVVSQVQKANVRYYGSKAMHDPNCYLYIDTAKTSLKSLDEANPNTTIINLGSFKPLDYYNTEVDKNEVNKWFDGENIIMPSGPLSEGARGTRQLSRMAFHYNPEYKRSIVTLLDSFKQNNINALLNNKNNLDQLKLYVVTGSAGGTGSGIFMDLLFTIWRYYIDGGSQGNMDVRAIILMPNLFLHVSDLELQNKYRKNGYAFIQELNALVKQGCSTNKNDQFYNYLTGQYKTVSKQFWQPIRAGILVDDTNQNFDFIGDNLYDVIGEFLIAYTLGNDFHGKLLIKDNNSKGFSVEDLLAEALINSDPDTNLPYINYFSSFGLLVIKSANEYFDQFVKKQLFLDVLISIIGEIQPETGTNLDPDYIKLTNKIGDEFRKLEQEKLDSLIIPNKLSANDQKELSQLIDNLDFTTVIPNSNNEKLKVFIQDINNLKKAIDSTCENLQKYLYRFHEGLLSEGKSLRIIKMIYSEIDKEYYRAYIEESKLKIEYKKAINYFDSVKSKVRKYLYYMLSKGDEITNDNGYFDIINNHIISLEKEANALESNHVDLINTLNSLLNNGATRLVPDINEIVSIKNDTGIIKPDGTFVRWYDELKLDINKIHRDIMSNLYKEEGYHYKSNHFLYDNFNSALSKGLIKNIESVLASNTVFIKQMSKSIYDIIREVDGQLSFDYVKNFDYPYIKLTKQCQASKRAYAGFFNRNNALAKQLGFVEGDINEILLDDAFYKDRLVKIVFHPKISLDKYFNFEDLKSNFEKNFTKLKLQNKFVASPFLHKDLAGPLFDGDVLSVLNSAVQKNIKLEFDELQNDDKQLLYKFGLAFMFYYVEKGINSNIFKPGFNKDFIKLDTSSKIVTLLRITYSSFLDEYTIDPSFKTDILLTSSINIQGLKEILKSSFKYLLENKENNLDEIIEVEVIKLSFIIFNDNKLGNILQDFANIRDKKIFKPFLDFYGSIIH